MQTNNFLSNFICVVDTNRGHHKHLKHPVKTFRKRNPCLRKMLQHNNLLLTQKPTPSSRQIFLSQTSIVNPI